MDTKHRKVYATLKQAGVAEPKRFDEGMAFVQLLPAIGRHIASLPNRYTDLTLHMSFEPIVADESEMDKVRREFVASLGQLEPTSEEDEQRWLDNPMNPNSMFYDETYHQYMLCRSPSNRATKTPADLAFLRKHMEEFYTDSKWWNGSHPF